MIRKSTVNVIFTALFILPFSFALITLICSPKWKLRIINPQYERVMWMVRSVLAVPIIVTSCRTYFDKSTPLTVCIIINTARDRFTIVFSTRTALYFPLKIPVYHFQFSTWWTINMTWIREIWLYKNVWNPHEIKCFRHFIIYDFLHPFGANSFIVFLLKKQCLSVFQPNSTIWISRIQVWQKCRFRWSRGYSFRSGNMPSAAA